MIRKLPRTPVGAGLARDSGVSGYEDASSATVIAGKPGSHRAR